MKLYFDKVSGVLLKRERELEEPPSFEKVLEEVTFSDYREKNGLKHYTKIVFFRNGKKVMDARVTDMEFLTKVDAKVFAKP